MELNISGFEFKTIRRAKKLSQSEISRVLGVATITVKAWEAERRMIPRSINNFMRMSIIPCPAEQLKAIAKRFKEMGG